MFEAFLCRRVDLCSQLDLEISQSIELAGENLKTTSLSTAPLAYDFFRFVSVPQEDQDRLAGVELRDGHRGLDPLAIGPDHPTAQSRPARKLRFPLPSPAAGRTFEERVGLWN